MTPPRPSPPPFASDPYVASVRAVLAHSHGMALDLDVEGSYVAECERADVSPRIAAEAIATHARGRAANGKRHRAK